jgi:hypothetical protein
MVQNDTTGTIGNAMGLYSMIKNPSGTVTTGHGVYIDSIQATNKYGLYQADATAQNIFSGNVGIGTTYANTKLQVNGGSISNDTSIYLTQTNASSNSFNAVTLEPTAGWLTSPTVSIRMFPSKLKGIGLILSGTAITPLDLSSTAKKVAVPLIQKRRYKAETIF